MLILKQVFYAQFLIICKNHREKIDFVVYLPTENSKFVIWTKGYLHSSLFMSFIY